MPTRGGETTGTVITFGKTTWELDLGDNEKLRAKVEKLDGKKGRRHGQSAHEEGRRDSSADHSQRRHAGGEVDMAAGTYIE